MRMGNVGLKNFLIQAIKFMGISGIGWVLDFSTYMVLGIFSENFVLNNTVSSWVGVTFVFIFATRRLFSNSSKIPLKWKYAIYLIYQCLLIYLISKLLNYITIFILVSSKIELIGKFSAAIAKILVTPVTMALNFLVMKAVIEKI